MKTNLPLKKRILPHQTLKPGQGPGYLVRLWHNTSNTWDVYVPDSKWFVPQKQIKYDIHTNVLVSCQHSCSFLFNMLVTFLQYFCVYPSIPSYLSPLQLPTPLYISMLFLCFLLLLFCLLILSGIDSMHFVTFLSLPVKCLHFKIGLC